MKSNIKYENDMDEDEVHSDDDNLSRASKSSSINEDMSLSKEVRLEQLPINL
jgi:hypothetical protein